MKATLGNVTADALSLPPDDRARLTRALIQSLEQEPEDDPTLVEAAWQAEISRRVEEIKSGKVQGVPADAVFAKLRAKHG
jgi:putative addiction module component (TIGR02574 family)